MRQFRAILVGFVLVLACQAGCGQPLFEAEEPLEIRLQGNVGELMKDRDGEPRYFAFTLVYSEADGKLHELPVQVRTRGHFRRIKANCTLPPLLLDFKEAPGSETVFHHQKKLKLVMPCRGEKYVVREYLVYKLYQQITQRSFQVRLVRVSFHDDVKDKIAEPVFGILLEDDDAMAGRNGMKPVTGRLVKPEQTEANDFHMMAVFQYLIGNTDWSVQYLQNIKLMARDSAATPVAVPYDFDHAGIVGAPYARPAEALQLTSTRERRYRGYCVEDMKVFDPMFDHFIAVKEKIYRVYADCKWVEEAYKKSTIRFLDDFYKTIRDSKRAAVEFTYPCLKDGTGNVVIKGLR
jgi:hypothetical protein